jgi:integrase
MTTVQIEHRSHGVYRLRWYGESGKRRSRTIHGTKQDAIKEKQRMISRLQGALHIPEGPPTIDTLEDMLQEVKYSLISDKYKRNIQHALDRCRNIGTRIDRITDADIQYQMSRMRSNGLSNSTINNWYATARAAFQEAVRYGLIDKNPFKGVKKLKKIIQPVNTITADQEQKLLDICTRKKDKCIIILALYGGLRAQEISRLNIRKDLDDHTVTVRSTQDSQTKSGKSRIVTIPSHDQSYTDIDPWALIQGYCTVRLKRHTAHPFYSNGAAVSRRFHVLKKRAAIECTLHDLRRTCATRLANDHNVGPWELMDYMGHAQIETTQKYYRGQTTRSFKDIWKV